MVTKPKVFGTVTYYVTFFRMTLYRSLEDSEDIIANEDELQSIAISHIAKKFDKLIERKVVRPFDTRVVPWLISIVIVSKKLTQKFSFADFFAHMREKLASTKT